MLIKQAFEYTTFNNGFNGIITDAVVLSDNKIVVVGCFDKYNNTTVNGICRLYPDGELDKTFNTGTGLDNLSVISKIEKLPDDSIILVGGSNYNGAAKNYNIIKIDYDGSINSSFNFIANGDMEGAYYGSYVKRFYNLPYGASTYEGIAVGLTSLVSGSCIASRGYDGSATLESGSLSGGALDLPSFDIGGSIAALSIPVDNTGVLRGALIIHGAQTVYAYNPNIGSTRTTGAYTANNIIEIVEADPALNKYYIGGNFTTYNGVSCGRICRLMNKNTAPYGQVNFLDTSFNTGTGFNSIVTSLHVDSAGKILVGGGFSSFNGTSISKICRLNQDGSLDTSFSSSLNDVPRKIIEMPNKNILIVGDFTKGLLNKKQNYITILDKTGKLIS